MDLRDIPRLAAKPGQFPARSDAAASRSIRTAGAADDDCGCALGAKCMALGFVVTLLGLALQHGAFTPAFFWRSPLALLVAFVCAGLGKAAGMAAARRRHRRGIGGFDAMRPSSPAET